MKSLFYNPEIEYLRSGWRIGIFVLIFFGCTIVIGLPTIFLLKQVFDVRSMALQMFLTYVALTVATWVMLRFIDKRPFRSVGLTFTSPWLLHLTQGTLLGAGMMTVIFIILYSTGMVTIEFRVMEFHQGLFIFINSLFLYIVVGYGEELMFRGYLFQVFAEGTNRIVATVTISVLFAFVHAKNPNVSLFGLINVGLAGIWLSIAYIKTNSLWLPVGLHFSWNFFQGFVFSLPVSGTTSDKEQIGRAIVTGPDWFTGGTFGPEGGMLATILLIAASALIYRSPWFSASPDAWQYEQWNTERKNALAPQQSVQQISPM
ncbi:MAG: CPBP family intramembrane glutamic endopeptidase [Bacteroidota bacterium]